MMSQNTIVAGVGMTQFKKPGKSESYLVMASQAIFAALQDSGLEYSDIQQSYAGYVMGDSTSGQAAAYKVGLSGIPIFNVNNNCASGSTALFLARQAVQSGAIECALAFGFEQMTPGAIENVFSDREPPLQRFIDEARSLPGMEAIPDNLPMVAILFGAQYLDLKNKYGVDDETFARITVKARRHAANNPAAIFRDPVSIEEVLAAPVLFGGLTRLMACAPSCGAGAAILCSEAFAKKHGIDSRVRITGQALTSDTDAATQLEFCGYEKAEEGGVDLARSEVIVSAGRGIGKPENIEMIETLAKSLGGDFGASRPVVDSGWTDHNRQIGTTGQTVSPKLYVACGISGAIQHLAGMKKSEFVVAVNTDKDAPIGEVADVLVVADLKEFIPSLIAKL